MMKLVNMLVNWIPFVPCYAPWTLKLDQMRRCPPESPEDVFFLRKSKLQQQTRVLEQVMVEHLGLGRGPEHLSR